MNPNPRLLAIATLAASFFVPLQIHAQTDPNPTPLGAEKASTPLIHVQIENVQGEHLGSIKDLGIDLANGRIVEVLVASGGFLSMGAKIVSVPPLAFRTDGINKVFVLDVSVAAFKAAPGVNLSKWDDASRVSGLGATYRRFGQEPYFLEEGARADPKSSRPKVPLGYVGRSNKTIGLPVRNLQGEELGEVSGLTFDIATARVVNVLVRAPGNTKAMSVIPPMALAYTSSRQALLLDRTQEEYAKEPRFAFTPPANGQEGSSTEESYKGPKTAVALEQGKNATDQDRTAAINKDIRLSKINARNVQVGTLDGRVTLRGWVETAEDQRRIGELAVAASKLELVDNQITVGKPVTAK